MRDFDPTLPRPGRLARLGVVIEPADPRAGTMARLCDRAGIEAVWLRDGSGRGSAHAGHEGGRPSEDMAAIAGSIDRARVGWRVDDDASAPAGAVELWFADAASASAAVRTPGSTHRWSATVADLADLPGLLAVVDDVVLPAWHFPDLETAADEARAEALEAGRDPGRLGVAAVLPVSIGRTDAEATARADHDPAFRRTGHPRDVGIFGTLEECQDRVIALAHAGITDLRCVLPSSLDIHDVIAQLTAITLGTTDVLVPGSLRSPAPPPPDGWGGRPDVPPRPGVSGGSRRR